MKKNYVAPRCTAVVMESAETILAGSTFSTDGGANSSILPGDDAFDGAFRSNSEGSWNVWDN